ncbi:MAG: hypothetical protein ABJA57_05360 [Ginsengibacter sp.]
MEGRTKIHLSPMEMGMVNDAGWILTKHNIIKKVYGLFSGLSEAMKVEVTAGQLFLPLPVTLNNARISKGENYKILPYVMLDYPSLFSKENIFAVRTMFWWGNFFSITLHISGAFKQLYVHDDPAILENLKKSGAYVCVNDSQWQHHFETSNYIAASDITATLFQKISEKDFIKIAYKIPLTEWDNAEAFLLKSFRELMIFLKTNFQGGGKDL